MIIGLTGTNASGKGTVATYLVEKGFSYYSLSDELRILMKQEGAKLTRENFIEKGRFYREKKGNDYFAKLVKKKFNEKDAVVDSIRNLGEIEEFRKLNHFFLIAIDAPIDTRFERSRKRKSERDERTLKEFILKEKKEMMGKGAEQQLEACMAQADFQIINDSDLENLYKKIDDTLQIAKNDSER